MADRKLVIKIPEEEYEMIVNSEDCGLHPLTRAIAHGVILPKGYGRIADVDKMLDEMRATRTYDILFALERVKPILEADKEGEDADSN